MKELDPSQEKIDSYDVFISYSHADKTIAERLSKRIRRYAPPKQLGLGKKRLQVFRDVERLTASADLSTELSERIHKSKRLLLLCSPSAAKSPYVNAEVQEFIKVRGINSILFVLCRGEFNEALPPCIQDEASEPLYVDFRDIDRRRFNLESLRLIAALLGVDYSELRREDETVRRRSRNGILASALFLLFIVFSMYLVVSTAPEGWSSIPQPYTPQEVMPVHEIAINIDDPNIILYNGYDARWGMNPRPEGVDYLPSDRNYDFELAVHDFVREQSEITPLATIKFELLNGNGSGEIVVYGVAEYNNDNLRYIRSLDFQGKTDAGEMINLAIEPTILLENNDPFNLSPWPLELLISKGVMESSDSIDAIIYYYTDNTESNVTFSEYYKDEGYAEWVAIFGPQNLVFSNIDSEELQIGGERLKDIENEEDLWSRILASESWVTYQPPLKKEVGLIYSSNEEIQTGIAAVIGQIPDTKYQDELINLLSQVLLEAEFSDVVLYSGSAAGVRVSILEVTGHLDSAELPADLPTKWLIQNSAFPGWHLLAIPTDKSSSKVVDVKPLSEDGQKILLVTDQGIFRSEDGGTTWIDISFGENAFSSGRSVNLIIVGDEPRVFALVDKNMDFNEGENQLFEFVHRDFLERWRLGLIQILQ